VRGGFAHERPHDNRAMTIYLRYASAVGMAALGLLPACTPTMNWRDVRFDNSPVAALLPCKPDRATRSIALGGVALELVMAGCEAGGAMFTVSYIDVGTGTNSQAALERTMKDWKAATKTTQAVYQIHGTQLVQAAVYGTPNAERDGPSALSTQALETFFGGLRVQR
jgi:hypothetical protein